MCPLGMIFNSPHLNHKNTQVSIWDRWDRGTRDAAEFEEDFFFPSSELTEKENFIFKALRFYEPCCTVISRQRHLLPAPCVVLWLLVFQGDNISWQMEFVHRCGKWWGVNWPWLRVEVLLMSPEIKEDSDCFLTVSFHILLIRLCQVNKGQSLGL